MDHKGTRKLETERLTLRRFIVDDAKAMYDNWASDPEVTKYLTWPCHDSVQASEDIIKDWISRYDAMNCYLWAIVMNDNGDAPIGSISVVQANEDVSIVQIGYCIGKNWWGQGLTSEALGAVIRFLFDEVGANRVEARHDPRNHNSGKVMLKCGMRYEGTMREADRNNQGICDESWYAILAKDYQA